MKRTCKIQGENVNTIEWQFELLGDTTAAQLREWLETCEAHIEGDCIMRESDEGIAVIVRVIRQDDVEEDWTNFHVTNEGVEDQPPMAAEDNGQTANNETIEFDNEIDAQLNQVDGDGCDLMIFEVADRETNEIARTIVLKDLMPNDVATLRRALDRWRWLK